MNALGFFMYQVLEELLNILNINHRYGIATCIGWQASIPFFNGFEIDIFTTTLRTNCFGLNTNRLSLTFCLGNTLFSFNLGTFKNVFCFQCALYFGLLGFIAVSNSREKRKSVSCTSSTMM